MLREPCLKYSLLPYTGQVKDGCVASAICDLVTKEYQIKGINIKLDEAALDQKLRLHFKDWKGGLNLKKSLDYVQKFGIEIYKIKEVSQIAVAPFLTMDWLFEHPLIANIKIFYPSSIRIQDGFYKLGTEKTGHHAICIFGYETDGFLVADGHYKQMFKIREQDFQLMIENLYFITI